MIGRFVIPVLFAAVCTAGAQVTPPIVFGADLSYVNEMEDCGGVYRVGGQARDPFTLFAERGANLVRVRLWHNPTWTDYSTFHDAQKTISRAKAAGTSTLLAFHYSDDWADPGSQTPPAAWQGLPFDVVKDSVYAYTYRVMADLAAEGLAPEMVQIGNEINPGMLLPYGSTSSWTQLGAILNEGIRAVRDASTAAGLTTKVILHVAQPENTHAWIKNVINVGGVTDFDVIGLSYYKAYSSVPINQLSDHISRLTTAYSREVIVVETGYPWTLSGNDGANNLFGVNAIQIGYPASPDGQSRYLRDLTQAILDGGGSGIVYWEPAWISTGCSTRWGQGSHWENVTFFDFENSSEVLPAIDYMSGTYERDRTIPVNLRVLTTGHQITNGVFVAGDMTYDSSGEWQPHQLSHDGGDWHTASFNLRPNTAYRFVFYNGLPSQQNREPIPLACAGDGGENRLLSVGESGGTIEFGFGTCSADELADVTLQVDMTGQSTVNGVYVAGDLTKNAADQWTFRTLDPVGGNLYATTFRLVRGGRYPFAFYTGTSWASGEKEPVPFPCATAWGTHRTLEVPNDDQAIRYRYGSCLVTNATSIDPIEKVQTSSVLRPHYPNPVDNRMTFVYELSHPTSVRLSLFDLLGREVAVVDEGRRLAAQYEIEYDIRGLPAGVYFYRLTTGAQSEGRTLIVL